MISLDEACTCKKPIDSGRVYRVNNERYKACRRCGRSIVCYRCIARLRKREKIKMSDEFKRNRTRARMSRRYLTNR